MPGLLKASDLNRYVTIERATDSGDDQGGQARSWASIGNAFVKASPTGGSEALVAGVEQATQSWRIEMWWLAGLTEKDRFTASWLPAGHAIALSSVADPDGMRERLVCFGTSGPA